MQSAVVYGIAAVTAVAAVVLATRRQRRRRLPRRIVLVRHGESRGNATSATKEDYRKTQDHLIEITETGEQAMAAGEALRAILRPEPTSTAKAKFFVSPYKRCTETLDTILSVLPPDIRVGEITIDNLLREYDRGYYGQSHEDVMAWNAARKAHGACQFRYPNGESLEDVYARASAWVALFRTYLDVGYLGDDESVVVVCHCGLMLQVANRLLGKPAEFLGVRSLPNCAIFVFDRHDVAMEAGGGAGSAVCYSPDPATHDLLQLPPTTEAHAATADDASQTAHRLVEARAAGPLVFSD